MAGLRSWLKRLTQLLGREEMTYTHICRVREEDRDRFVCPRGGRGCIMVVERIVRSREDVERLRAERAERREASPAEEADD